MCCLNQELKKLEEVLGNYLEYGNTALLKSPCRWKDREMIFAPIIKSISIKVTKEWRLLSF